jgi:hypothetical protein
MLARSRFRGLQRIDCAERRVGRIAISKTDEISSIPSLKGVQFVTDPEGRRVAVILDLREWGELWEDIYDNLVADRRAAEPTMALTEFEIQLRSKGLLNERD